MNRRPRTLVLPPGQLGRSVPDPAIRYTALGFAIIVAAAAVAVLPGAGALGPTRSGAVTPSGQVLTSPPTSTGPGTSAPVVTSSTPEQTDPTASTRPATRGSGTSTPAAGVRGSGASAAITSTGRPSTSTAEPDFTSRTIDATAPGNTVSGGAEAVECAGCVSGSRVRYLAGAAAVTVPVRGVEVAGQRTLTVVYESDGERELRIAVNDEPVQLLTLAGAGDWETPARVRVRVNLDRGANTMVFSNPEGPAPDLDQFQIS